MKFRILNPGETRVLVLRHGTTAPNKTNLPNDTISDESYAKIRDLGNCVRAAGLRVTRVVSSPRGRAVISGFAFAEGNARPGESVAPFQTNKNINDVSSKRPDIVTRLKAIAESHGCTTEQAILKVFNNAEIHGYIWDRAKSYASCFLANATDKNGETNVVPTHGGLADIAIAILREYGKQVHVGGRWLNDLINTPQQWLNKGQTVELIFNADGKLVEANYLE